MRMLYFLWLLPWVHASSCNYMCPLKDHVPRINRSYVPQSNGCGSYGIVLTSDPYGLEPCCHAHDFCYETCNRSKDYCDTQFSLCLAYACHKNRACENQALVYTWSVETLGCTTYLQSQQNACMCD